MVRKKANKKTKRTATFIKKGTNEPSIIKALESQQTLLSAEVEQYKETADAGGLKKCIELVRDEAQNLIRNQKINEEIFKLYHKLLKDLVYYSILMDEMDLSFSIYEQLCPRLPSMYLQETDMERKEEFWDANFELLMNYFIIQHKRSPSLFSEVSSFVDSLRMLKRFQGGTVYVHQSLFIEVMIDTYPEWGKKVSIEEEEQIWLKTVDWLILDQLNLVVHKQTLTIYEKANHFYREQKKTKRLDDLTYRILDILVMILGVSCGKVKYYTLIDNLRSFIKHLKLSYAQQYKSSLSSIVAQITTLWELGETHQDQVLFKDLIKEVMKAQYKKEMFYQPIIAHMNIESLFKSKAYVIITDLYENHFPNLEDWLQQHYLEYCTFEIAYSLQDCKKYQKAKSLYESLLEKGQVSSAVYNNLANIYSSIDKNYDKAMEYYEQAIKIEPDDELFTKNREILLEKIKKEKERPKRQIQAYFKQTDKQHKKICFTIYKLEEQDKISDEDIARATGFSGQYLKKLLNHLQSHEIILHDPKKGWQLEEPVRQKVQEYVDPKLERQIIRNNQAVMYRPIFYHEAEILLYRVLNELFPQHLVFPNMDLKTIIQVEKIRNHLDSDILDYLFKAHVDFAIIDTTTYFPILTFERDSEYQDQEPQKTNAMKKNIIFQTSGLPLIRIRYSTAMDYERLKEEIKQATKDFILEIRGDQNAETKRILQSIDVKRFGIYEDIPTTNEMKSIWNEVVGEVVAAHTISVELNQNDCILMIILKESVRSILELGADNIKSKLYQLYPVLNSIQFRWQ